jgi:hypothetical protein
MLRTVAILWAGGFIAVLAGCSIPIGKTGVEVGVKVNEEAVNDSLEHVAVRLQTEMSRMGLQATTTSEGDTARIVSATKSGQKFIVVLNRQRGPLGEQTKVHIDWEKGSDSVLWPQLILIAGQTTLTAR